LDQLPVVEWAVLFCEPLTMG